MAGYNDPEGPYTQGAAGASTHLGHVTDITNKFDKDATPASGDTLVWNGTVYVPAVPMGGVSAARFASAGVVNTAAFDAAVAATPAGGTLFLPKSLTYSLASVLTTITDINIDSDGAVINFTADAGVGAYGMTLSGSGAYPLLYVRNVSIHGPGTRGALGTSPCDMHGVRLTGDLKVKFENTSVDLFNRGVEMNTNLGHLYFNHSEFTDNFYGLYLAKNSSDYFFTDCEINGNLFAGIGMPADQGFDGAVFENSHMGFQPYGIFQDNAPAAQGSPKLFLQDALFYHTRFEAIGNGAIVSEATVDASNKSTMNAVKIIQPGFSWNATYKIAARNKNYAVDVGFVERTLEIDSGTFAFTAGDTGVFRFDQVDSNGFIILRGTAVQVSASQISIGTGSPSIQIGGAPVMAAAAQQYNTGDYYSVPTARTTGTRPNNHCTYLPLRIDRDRTFVGIAVEVTVAGNAGATIRVGVHRASVTNGKPSSLLLEGGSVVADTTGVKTITGLTMVLTPGWYYLTAAVQNAATTLPTLRLIAAPTPGAPVYNTGVSLASGAGYADTGAISGALPANASANPTDTVVCVALIA